MDQWFEDLGIALDSNLPGARSPNYILVIQAVLEGQRVTQDVVIPEPGNNFVIPSQRAQPRGRGIRGWLLAEAERDWCSTGSGGRLVRDFTTIGSFV